MILIDSHCHLNLLADKDNLGPIIERAAKNNVKYMQTIATSLADFSAILQIAEKYDNVFASVGVHPCEVEDIMEAQTIIDLSQHQKVISVGETGLDYYHTPYDKKQQIQSFVQHIHASQATKLPIIVHTREAEEDTIDLISSEMKNAQFPGLIHCFTSSKYLAKKMLDIGLYISISGIITFKNALDLQEIVRYVPLDRLLIETDAPYLAPVPMRGRQNEPAFVRFVAEKIADIKQNSFEEVCLATTQNFTALFSKFHKYL